MGSNRRCVVMVIDGLGVGEMPDVANTRVRDRGAHTLKHIVDNVQDLYIPNFISLGILSYYCRGIWQPHTCEGYNVSLGKLRLAHPGADSYLGHQELAGTLPKKPVRQFVRHAHGNIIRHLAENGIRGVFNGKFIEIEPMVVVADNIETDYGLNINVIGSIDHMCFREIEQIGRIVRKSVRVGRVITMGGTGLDWSSYIQCFQKVRRDGYTAWGLDVPKLGIYNEFYRVNHMGFGIRPDTQVTTQLVKHSVPVTLIGKTADVIEADGATYIPAVRTESVVSNLMDALTVMNNGFIFANIQETDLAGHEEDSRKFGRQIEYIDKMLPLILDTLCADDLFMIVGDHGNDPAIGHSNHTREMTPCILFSKRIPPHNIGIRRTLADVGATVADYFSIPYPESGVSMIASHPHLSRCRKGI